MSASFPCNNCGACCKSIRKSELTLWLDRGDGVCKNFDDNKNICLIYENRPEVCNIKVMYEKFYSDEFTWVKFVELNQRSCDFLLNEVKDDIRFQN